MEDSQYSLKIHTDSDKKITCNPHLINDRIQGAFTVEIIHFH